MAENGMTQFDRNHVEGLSLCSVYGHGKREHNRKLEALQMERDVCVSRNQLDPWYQNCLPCKKPYFQNTGAYFDDYASGTIANTFFGLQILQDHDWTPKLQPKVCKQEPRWCNGVQQFRRVVPSFMFLVVGIEHLVISPEIKCITRKQIKYVTVDLVCFPVPR
jgi:hypothetical protein